MNAVVFLLVMLIGLLLCLRFLLNRYGQPRLVLHWRQQGMFGTRSAPRSIISLKQLSKLTTVLSAVTIAVLIGNFAAAQIAPVGAPPPLAPLNSVPVPEPTNLADFVSNKAKAIELGKALFWDMQVGSDNIQSCATCHFHAGADNRSKNQINPGLLSQLPTGAGFQLGGGPNYQLKTTDYPFHKLSDVNNRNSTVLSDVNDIASSQGVLNGLFSGKNPIDGSDIVTYQADPEGFRVGNANVRRVAPRNAPSVINAVYNFRNFWDGRAQNDFNGRNPFGSRDPNARIVKVTPLNQLQAVKVSLDNASLASLATGPPLSTFEMSAAGRKFPDIGARFSFTTMRKGKLLSFVRVLGKQQVSRTDSVLGKYSISPEKGLNQSYPAMIRAAFKPEYWNSTMIVQIDASSNPLAFKPAPARALAEDEFSLIDYNAPLFFGLAVQLYQATLISDDTPLDRFLLGNVSALTPQQKRGKVLFEGSCLECHGGAEMTVASTTIVKAGPLERMIMGDGGTAVYDAGFYNSAVRPTKEDIGLGGTDPFGKPLSMSRLAQVEGRAPAFGLPLVPPLAPTERVAVNGAFKTPGLRNIALTAPYFHNGGTRTLKEVVDFYNRGGDFHEQNIADLDAGIVSLNMTEAQKQDMVAFMEGLTDDRVLFERAPFDHPELLIPNGAVGNQTAVTSIPVNGGVNNAVDIMVTLPAVGSTGGVRIDNSAFPKANFLTGPVPAGSAPAPANAQPLAGSITQQDCPTGTSLSFVTGGFVCMPAK
jgi:cytochrome c peroxidase